MKSEWQFMFEAKDFVFEKEVKYLVTADELVSLGGRPPEKIEAMVRIVPSKEAAQGRVAQTGNMFITLPYSQEDTKEFAYHIAGVVTEQISFHSGDFSIHYGGVICKRIAETPEEEKEFGDKLYSIEMRLQEVIPPPSFRSDDISKTVFSPDVQALISQYNETKKDSSNIRQFLGYFRILESLFHSSNKKIPLKKAFITNEELRTIFDKYSANLDFEDFVKHIVNVRHKCAHLKMDKGFGYTPADPGVSEDIDPYLRLLAIITHNALLDGSLTSSEK